MSEMRVPELYEIVREPSVEAFVDFAQSYNKPHGKFIRTGGVLLVAPLVEVARMRREPTHLDMDLALYEYPELPLAQKIMKASREADQSIGLPRRRNLMDAGSYETRFSEAGQLSQVIVYGESYDFGRADDEGRAETTTILQAYLGDMAVRVSGK